MFEMNRIACVMLLAGLLVTTGCAQTGGVRESLDANVDKQLPRHYACHRASAPIDIDGRLDDAAWSRAPWTSEFVDIEGDAKPRPRFATQTKMLWDDEYFYIAAQLEEPHAWGTLRDHDDIVFRDNDFEIFIDPNGDRREYYEIEINALGTIFDLFLVRTYIDGGPALHSWDCKRLLSAVHIDGTLNDPSDTDRGWSVEFAIPWKSLAEAAGCESPPRDGDIWRVNFSRVEWQINIDDGRYTKVPHTPEDNWVWSPQGVINMHVPEHWGYVRFVREKSPPLDCPLASACGLARQCGHDD